MSGGPARAAGITGRRVAASAGVIPAARVEPTRTLSAWLTVLAMAALGLGVDLEAIRTVGRPVIVTVTASLAVLIALSLTLIHVPGIR